MQIDDLIGYVERRFREMRVDQSAMELPEKHLTNDALNADIPSRCHHIDSAVVSENWGDIPCIQTAILFPFVAEYETSRLCPVCRMGRSLFSLFNRFGTKSDQLLFFNHIADLNGIAADLAVFYVFL